MGALCGVVISAGRTCTGRRADSSHPPNAKRSAAYEIRFAILFILRLTILAAVRPDTPFD